MATHQYRQLAQRLCALNNKGVVLLESNTPEKAVVLFGECLLIGKELGRRLPPKGDVPASQDSPRCCPSSILSSKGKCQKEDKLFIYQSALVLPEECCSLNETSIHIYSAVVVFNLALVYHHVGMKTGKTRSLTKAEHFYENSIRLLDGLDPLSYNGTTLLIFLAANNNLAHIALEKGMVEPVSIRFRFLSHVLHQSNAMHREIFTNYELNGILSNILMGNGLGASPAA
jgi:hypothetical protein